MTDLRTIFKLGIASIDADHRQSTTALITRLKGLSATRFLAEPPETIRQLTDKQYREIVAAIAPDVTIPLPIDRFATEKIGIWGKLTAFWRARAPLTRAISVSVAMAILITISLVGIRPLVAYGLAPITLHRSQDFQTWPACPRLAWDTDGCLYVSHVDLDWDQLAELTRINAGLLQRMNAQLDSETIPAGSRIIIWRDRTSFRETSK